MKTTLALLVLSTSLSALAGNVIKLNHNDVLTPNLIQYDVDGIEMWNIKAEDQEAALTAFSKKCSQEIPARFSARLSELSVDAEDFNMTTSVETKTYRRFGDHHICRAEVKIIPESKYAFEFDYSKIYRKLFREDVYQDCKGLVTELDGQVSELNLLDRRAYFDAIVPKEGEIEFVKCQILGIKVGYKKIKKH
jgi:hypothetical protein